MERKKLAPGVFITTLDAEKFNRCRITIHLRYPALRRSATDAAVLPLVLERGYAGCPDMTELSRKLARLYGADLGVDQSSAGIDRVLTVDICGIKDRFALDGENLTREYADIAFGTIFEPYLIDGVFDPEAEITYLGSPAPGDYTIRVSCSKGTYIRVLAEDIGTALGVPATLAALRRTRAGAFKIEECHTLPEILAAAEAGTLQQSGWLLPVEHVFASLPALTVDDAVKKHLFNGCPTSHYRAQDGKYRVYDAAGTFLGLANVTQGVLQVEKIFCERA